MKKFPKSFDFLHDRFKLREKKTKNEYKHWPSELNVEYMAEYSLDVGDVRNLE